MAADDKAAIRITSSRPHGAVATVLPMTRKLGLDRIIDRTPSRERRVALALIVQRPKIFNPTCCSLSTAIL